MEKLGHILVIHNNENELKTLCVQLDPHCRKVTALASPESALPVLQDENIDAILLDSDSARKDSKGGELHWLTGILKRHSFATVILAMPYNRSDLALRSIRKGAADFIFKPFDIECLLATLREAIFPPASGQPAPALRSESGIYWGISPAMQDLRLLTGKAARTDARILITGENGTGKEMLARELHRLSPRYRKPLIAVDMKTLPHALFERELFGCQKGAFPDAFTDSPGKFETARRGTLFLDEIGNLSLSHQTGLLNVLQSRTVFRAGSTDPISTDVRLICSTNKNIDEMVQFGKFIKELFSDAATIQLKIPSLRQRPQDIAPLCNLFLAHYTERHERPELRISPAAMSKLENYPWYGNIRELQHAIEKAVIFSEKRTLLPAAFKLPRRKNKTAGEVFILDESERNRIRQELEYCKGNLIFVAKHLGITCQVLYNKIKRYGL
jgi:DNA-binding NtrC family response regulator